MPRDATVVFDVCRQAYVAAREADLPVGVAREADGLPDDCGLYLVPSTKQLTAPTWRRLVELAEGGATVYASYFVGKHDNQRGPWWPDLDATFGVRKRLRYGLVDPIEDDALRVTFRVPFGSIAAGEELVFPVAGTVNSRAYLPVDPRDAEVLAEDAHGRPVLLRRRVGSGAMVQCTYPIEHMAALTPHVNPEPTWRIYAALAAEADVRPAVRVDDPRVLVGELRRDDGVVLTWFVSQSAEPLVVEPLVSGPPLVDAEGKDVREVRLEPFDVVVLERHR